MPYIGYFDQRSAEPPAFEWLCDDCESDECEHAEDAAAAKENWEEDSGFDDYLERKYGDD